MKHYIFLLLLLLFAFGCSDNSKSKDGADSDTNSDTDTDTDSDTDSDTDTDTDTDTDSDTSQPTDSDSNPADSETTLDTDSDSAAIGPHESDWVFDENEIREYHITMTAEDLTNLQEEGVDELYRPAALTVGDTTFEDIGIRLKGSYSLNSCFTGFGNPTRQWDGHCQKISLKLKFNQTDVDARLHSLKKLNLHSMGADLSKMHERLAYHLYREIGVLTPRNVPARVYINGQDMGIYQAVEAVDGRFTKYHFPDAGDGNLYKEIWPTQDESDTEELAEFRERVIEQRRTNEEDANIDDFMQFTSDITKTNITNYETTMVPHIDVPAILKYMVVDQAIHNWDGFRTFYWLANHNYYWYHTEAGPWVLIPWDMDKTFFEYDRFFAPDPAQNIDVPVPDWNVLPSICNQEFPDNMHEIDEVFGPPGEQPGHLQLLAPGCNPLFNTLAAVYFDDFVIYGNEFLDNLFTVEYLEAKLNTWEAQIERAMQTEFTIPYDNWKAEMSTLRSHLPKFRADLQAHLEDSYRVE